jgi:DeoR/GlpR family transcriptional regulator of sugar metabolism
VLAEERRRKLLQVLEKSGAVSVAEISERLQVSRMTVHRDLEALAAAGLLRKVHGGAVPVIRTDPAVDVAKPFTERKVVHTEAKERIGQHLAKLLEGARMLGLDASSTVFPLASFLKPEPGMFVVTDGIPMFTELQQRNLGIRVALTGGEAHPKTGSLIGPQAIKSLEGLRFDWAIVSAAGLMEDTGDIGDATPEMPAFKQALLARATKTALALDRSKINFLGPYLWGKLEDFDYLVTEDGPQETKGTKRKHHS